MTRIAIFGEVMLELSGADRAAMRLGFGGDTLNTAIYLARLGWNPAYITALGRDPYSDEMVSTFTEEGIDTRFILRHPSRIPGLYAIETDEQGERSFHYWRGQSAARDFFNVEGAERAVAEAANADLLYFSGISLSILDAEGRSRVLDLAADVRARGGKVAFDPNYRPKGWPEPEAARALFRALAPAVSFLLATDSDEDALFGCAHAEEHLARWMDWGVGEAVLKAGAQGAILPDCGRIPAVAPVRLVDTTGAGDSFNAAWLDARSKGASAAEAVKAGNRLAAEVIGCQGAIMPRKTA
ncbi:MAG: sugar kinase [Hyphomonas sp.]|uniref:sugar kinase n=1 Tax=Hyphomonas sp. TaxID=87 RepID=UPI0035286AE6